MNNGILFQNKWYRFSLDQTGNIKILDTNNQELLSSLNYWAEYGELYNIRFPLVEGDQKILLDRTDGLFKGDQVEIRNEFRRGLMNRPFVHPIEITKVEPGAVTFIPPVGKEICDQLIVSQKLSGVIQKTTERIRGFDQVAVVKEKRNRASRTMKVELIGETPKTSVTIRCLLDQNSPGIDIAVETRYKENVKVFNETLALTFADNVREVYRKNRKVDTEQFQEEYWLDKQGVRFGRGKRSVLIYHVPDISSLYLKTYQKQLRIHLEDLHDHRFSRDSCELAYNGTSLRIMDAYHAAEYTCGQVRVNRFTLTIGNSPSVLPRMMLNPHGFLAGMAWTEHADKSTLASHRAVYHGDERIEQAQAAVGGFVKYGVPVTKSVFYCNPLQRSYQGLIPLRGEQDSELVPQVALKENEEFLRFLKGLQVLGHEICLHGVSPSSLDETRERLEEAVRFMSETFRPKTWIDHGRNHCNFCGDGLDPASPYYAADFWKQHDTTYFWHYSSEDITHWHEGKNDLMQIARGDRYPTPLFWVHPTVTGPFYSWAAISTRKLKVFSENSLTSLIQNWGVCINHVYPPELPETLSTSEFLCQDSNQFLRSHPDFDETLSRMAKLREEGKLNVTTVSRLMDYWIQLQKVKFFYQNRNEVIILNQNKSQIKGISLAFKNKKMKIYVDGKQPEQKIIDDDLIIWFNLKPLSSVKISIKKDH